MLNLMMLGYIYRAGLSPKVQKKKFGGKKNSALHLKASPMDG